MRQVPGEYLEHRPTARRTAVQGGLQHGEFVMVSKQGSTRRRCPRQALDQAPGRGSAWRRRRGRPPAYPISHELKTTDKGSADEAAWQPPRLILHRPLDEASPA